MRLEGGKGGREGEEDLLHSPQTGEEEERHRGRREGTRQITISIHPPNAIFNVNCELVALCCSGILYRHTFP